MVVITPDKGKGIENVEKKEKKEKKCYFSTFIDEVTITCSSDGRFDFYGWPIKLCEKFPTCNIIKEKNENINKKERQ